MCWVRKQADHYSSRHQTEETLLHVEANPCMHTMWGESILLTNIDSRGKLYNVSEECTIFTVRSIALV